MSHFKLILHMSHYQLTLNMSNNQPIPNMFKYQLILNMSRFPLGTGIAGHVAATGETLSVPDVRRDERFNASVDEQVGYTR